MQRLGVARDLDVDDQRQTRQIDAARGDVGGDADPCAAVAQRLQRLVTLILAMLAGQGDGAEAALDQAGVEMADIVASRAEQHRRIGFVETQQVHDRILDVRGRHRHRLIADVAVAAVFPDRGDAQRVLLEALGQRDDRLGDSGREHQSAAFARSRVEDFLEILAETHVEHLVGFVEDGDAQRREVERAAFKVIAQPSRRADDDMRAMGERAAFLGRIHPADAGGDAGREPCRTARSARG